MKKNTLFPFVVVLLSCFTFHQLCYAQTLDNTRKIDPTILHLQEEVSTFKQKNRLALRSKFERTFSRSTRVTFEEETEFLDVFMDINGSATILEELGCRNITQVGNIVAVEIPLDLIEQIANRPEVRSISLPTKFKPLTVNPIDNDESGGALFTDVSTDYIGAKLARSTFGYDGEGVVIGIIDTGIDFSHPAFLDDQGNTRVLFLWDQNGPGGSPPLGFTIGREYSQATLNDNLSNPSFVPDVIGHGTHVAGIAAGSGASSTGDTDFIGVAPKADIIAVSFRGGWDPVLGLGAGTDLLRAVEYIAQKATALNKPWVVNISVGTIDGSVDGNSYLERGLNQIISDKSYGKGRLVVSAVGNDGYDIAADAGTGNIGRANDRKRIHYSASSTKTIEFEVLNSTNDALQDQISVDIFFPVNESIEVTLTLPDGQSASINTADRGDQWDLIQTEMGIYMINELRQNSSGANRWGSRWDHLVEVTIADVYNFTNEQVRYHLIPGIYTLKIKPSDSYHVYIRNYSQHFGSNGVVGGAFFTPDNYTNANLIGEPSNADRAISVGSINTKTITPITLAG